MSWPTGMPIIEVCWLDSNSVHGWRMVPEMIETVGDGDLRCRSVGYLFAEHDDRVVVIGHQSQTGAVAAAMTIPRCSITSLTVLQEAQP